MICSRCHLNCLPCRQTSLASDKAQSLTRTHGAPTAHNEVQVAARECYSRGRFPSGLHRPRLAVGALTAVLLSVNAFVQQLG